jgi:NADP-dependent 3-hydroxy acid dehydrogenase YdfG
MTLPPRLRRALRTAAWVSIIGSFPVWTAAFVVAPFLPLPAEQRAAVGLALIVAGEAMFWVAGLALGAEVMARFRAPKVRTGRSFRGRRVAVLGATGGLGAAIARAVVREGGEVVLLARDEARLAPLAAELSAPSLRVDLTDAASLGAAAAALEPVDHFVCATGVDVRKALEAHEPGEIAHELAVDLQGPILAARALLARLREGGSFAVLGGFADGGLALPYYSVDVAARAGLAAFCESMNRELALGGRTQRLSYLCPAPADTEAERPFGPLWEQMGTRPVPPAQVADFVLVALLQRRAVAVMGFGTRALAFVNRLSPALADLIALRRLGALLHRAFGPGAPRGGGDDVSPPAAAR